MIEAIHSGKDKRAVKWDEFTNIGCNHRCVLSGNICYYQFTPRYIGHVRLADVEIIGQFIGKLCWFPIFIELVKRIISSV